MLVVETRWDVDSRTWRWELIGFVQTLPGERPHRGTVMSGVSLTREIAMMDAAFARQTLERAIREVIR